MKRAKVLLLLFVGVALLETSIRADFKTERRLALEPGGSFTLDSEVGDIRVIGDSTSGVAVTVVSGRGRRQGNWRLDVGSHCDPGVWPR